MHRGMLATLFGLLAFTSFVFARDPAPAGDAAEAVQEGDVSQWLKYYQRERGMPPAQQRLDTDRQQQGQPVASDSEVPAPPSTATMGR